MDSNHMKKNEIKHPSPIKGGDFLVYIWSIFLKTGLLVTGSSKAWLGGFGELMKFTTISGIPSGVIVIWSGASNAIPSGWYLCNGSNGTPDLRDRFVVGAGNSYAVAATGGASTVALSTAQLPSHNHSFTGSSHSHTFTGTAHNHSGSISISGLTCSEDGNHSHGFYISTSGSGSYANLGTNASGGSKALSGPYITNEAGSHSHTISGSGSVSINNATAGGTVVATTASGSVGSTGSGSAHENRPPYYALCYIMKS
jgi:microcystin-dependent protein